jgi:hypothetical protein
VALAFLNAALLAAQPSRLDTGDLTRTNATMDALDLLGLVSSYASAGRR